MSILTADTVDILWNPQRGNTAFASRSFDAGDVVVEEEAILTLRAPFTDPKEMIAFHKYAMMTRVEEEYWYPIHASWKLPASIMKALVYHLYSPLSNPEQHLNKPSDILLLRQSPKEEAAILNLFSDEKMYESFFPKDRCLSRDYWDEQRIKITGGILPTNRNISGKAIFEVCSFIHACRINIHSNESQGLSVVLPTCCKFSHSCNPNTVWRLSVAEKANGDNVVIGRHIAVRSIEKGEELTFSYIGNGLNLLGDTLSRREALIHLHFFCRCFMCSRYDNGCEVSRRLPCKVCKRNGVVRICADTLAWECVSCKGYSNITASLEVEAILKIETFLHKIVFVCLFGSPDGIGGVLRLCNNNMICPVIREIILGNFLVESKILLEDDINQYHQNNENSKIFQNGIKLLEPWIVLTSQTAINPILKRWRILRAVLHFLGQDHYLFIISLIILLKSLRAAICACITSSTAATSHDWSDFLVKIRVTDMVDSGGCWLDELISWIYRGDIWFQTNQMNIISVQRLSMWRCYGDLVGLWTTEVSLVKGPLGLDERELCTIKDAVDRLVLETCTEDMSLKAEREVIATLKLPKLRKLQEFAVSIIGSLLQEIGAEALPNDVVPW